MLRRLFVLWLICVSSAVLAGEAAPKKAVQNKPAPANEASVRSLVQEKFPPAKIQSVTKTPYGGLYEVYMDGNIVYTDDQVTFVITNGEIIDTKTKARVTEQRMRKLTALNMQDLPPLTSAIKRVKGDGTRTLMVFSDPLCPFCRKLEQELVKLNNVSIYLWTFPVEHKFPGSTALSKSIWCSADKGKAWDEWMLQGKRPSARPDCANPVADIEKVGSKLGINVTPTLIFSDGAPVKGMLPAADLDRLLTQTPK